MRFFTPKERTIATIGYPGHGKSIFLAGMFWDSFFALSRTFQDGGQPYSVRALNEEASTAWPKCLTTYAVSGR